MDTVTVHGATRSAERLSVTIIRGMEASQTTLDAVPAPEGYFLLNIPLNHDNFQIAVLFGKYYRWVQILSTHLVETASQQSTDVWPYNVFDQMIHKGGKLYECQSEAGLLVFTPPAKASHKNHHFQILFRPIVKMDLWLA
jgi:hypothetical protein